MSEVKVKKIEMTSEGISEEEHPFNNPNDLKNDEKPTKYLIVGTFPPHRFGVKTRVVNQDKSILTTSEYGDEVFWFYGSKNNEMWGENGKGGLLQSALGYKDRVLDNKQARMDFCKEQNIAFLDLFQNIKRYGKLASDSYIFPTALVDLLYYLNNNHNKIETIFFTSGWVMDIAKKEYLRTNQNYLKKLYLRKNKTEKEGNIDYVANNCFYLESRDEENKIMEEQKGIKLIHLASPSPFAKTTSRDKLKQWQEAFSQVGLPKDK